jgi:hypothetical protein
LAQLDRHNVTLYQYVGGAQNDAMQNRPELTAQEFQTLQFAPFWLLSALIGKHRDFDELHTAAFATALAEAARSPGQLARDVFGSVAADQESVARSYAADGRPIVAGMFAVSGILRRMPADEAESFLTALVSGVGEGVARARGRFGQIISDDDADTLTLVAELVA